MGVALAPTGDIYTDRSIRISQGGKMSERQNLPIAEIQARLDRKLKESEIEILEYWKGQIDRIAAMKPEGIGALQLQIRRIAEMMENRIKVLKRERLDR
jgi:hypothetical protein